MRINHNSRQVYENSFFFFLQPVVTDPDIGTADNVYGLLEGTVYDSNSFSINRETFEVRAQRLNFFFCNG